MAAQKPAAKPAPGTLFGLQKKLWIPIAAALGAAILGLVLFLALKRPPATESTAPSKLDASNPVLNVDPTVEANPTESAAPQTSAPVETENVLPETSAPVETENVLPETSAPTEQATEDTEPTPISFEVREAGLRQFTLTEVAKIDNFDSTQYSFGKNYLERTVGGVRLICRPDGSVDESLAYDRVYSTGAKDYQTAVKSGEAVNATGLIRSDGTSLLDCAYAKIEALGKFPRFMAVTTADQPAQDNENTVFTASDGTNYSGKVEFFDLEAGRFVPNLAKTSRAEILKAFGSHPCIRRADGTLDIFDADGKLLQSVPNVEFFCSTNALILKTGGGCGVYNDKLEEIYRGGSIRPYEPDPGYLIEKSGGMEYLLSEDGRRLSPDGYLKIESIDFGCAVVSTEAGTGVVSLDGTVLIPPEADAQIKPRNLGYYFKRCGGKEFLCGIDGTVYPLVKDSDCEKLILFRKADTNLFTSRYSEGAEPQILRDPESTLQAGRLDPALELPGIVCWAEGYGKPCGLYDVINGTELLPRQYSLIQYSNGYLYAVQDGLTSTCTVYKLEENWY